MTSDQMARMAGQQAYDSTGQKIGDIQRVFYDRDTNEPTWITVRAGRFGGRETVVPLAGARTSPSGGLALAVRKDVVTDAPAIDVGSELTVDDVTALNRYYEHSMSMPPTEDMPRVERETGRAGMAGMERQQPSKGGEKRPLDENRPVELTSHEERIRVGTEPVDSGKVRLRKVVVTEPVETTVPLRHEEIRVERVPVDARPAPGHQFAEEASEVTLHEERPLISKETVAVETVRLSPETRTDQRRVTDQVRRERIEVEDQRPADDTRRRQMR